MSAIVLSDPFDDWNTDAPPPSQRVTIPAPEFVPELEEVDE